MRNSWLLSPQHKAQPFYDKAQWEQIKRSGNAALQRWIDTQLAGTSVTAVLIGPQTLDRPWVRYEIDKSLQLGKGLLGITLENMTQANQTVDTWNRYNTYGPFAGNNPTAPVYSWTVHNGRQNMASWIEQAARAAGR